MIAPLVSDDGRERPDAREGFTIRDGVVSVLTSIVAVVIGLAITAALAVTFLHPLPPVWP